VIGLVGLCCKPQPLVIIIIINVRSTACSAVVTTTYDSTLIRRSFDCNSTALRPFDDLRYDRAAALRPI